MKQIHFFALKDDLLPVLTAVERDQPVKYVRMGQFPNADYESFTHGAEIPHLGKASTDSAVGCESFLVTGRGVPINVRSIKTTSGIERYCVDQLINPDTVVFSPAGIWGEEVVLNGRVATVSNSAVSQEW